MRVFLSIEWKHVCSMFSIEWRIWRAWRYQFQSHLPHKIYNGATGRLLLRDHVERSFCALSIQDPVNSLSNALLQAHLLRHSTCATTCVIRITNKSWPGHWPVILVFKSRRNLCRQTLGTPSSPIYSHQKCELVAVTGCGCAQR